MTGVQTCALPIWLDCKNCHYIKNNFPHNIVIHKDSVGHWSECQDCSYKTSEIRHTFTTKNDDNKHWQECNDCGYKKNNERHILISDSDDRFVWHKCKNCEFSTEKKMYTIGLEYLFNESTQTYSVTGIGNATSSEVIVPSKINGFYVTEIAYNAFYLCDNITSIVLPSSIKTIDFAAFSDCLALESITLESSITNIYDDIILGCTVLESINFNGTMDEWRAVQKDKNWAGDVESIVIICVDGKLNKDGSVIVE